MSEPEMPTAAESSSSNKTNTDTVRMQSCDGEIFEVETEVASASGFIKMEMEDFGTKNILKLPTISAKILRLVIQYCRYHVIDASSAPSPDIVKMWDNEFAKGLVDDPRALLEVGEAAYYLGIENLLAFMCEVMADDTIGKTTEEMRKFIEFITVRKDHE